MEDIHPYSQKLIVILIYVKNLNNLIFLAFARIYITPKYVHLIFENIKALYLYSFCLSVLGQILLVIGMNEIIYYHNQCHRIK